MFIEVVRNVLWFLPSLQFSPANPQLEQSTKCWEEAREGTLRTILKNIVCEEQCSSCAFNHRGLGVTDSPVGITVILHLKCR